jgi:aquaporin Z
MTNKMIAEVMGTFILVFFGVGSAVLMGDLIGMHGIAMAFGLSIVAAAYGLGAISGAHLNPAVSLSQLVGAVLAAGVNYVIASGKAGYELPTTGLARTATARVIWANIP